VFNVGARDSIYTFTGSIDEVGFWNRALTSAERASIYNSGTGKAYPF
jgi:hypothetical protein